METNKCVYSLNGEDGWTTEIVDLESEITEELGDVDLYIGEQSPQDHDDFLSIHCLIEHMQEEAYFGNEFADDYLDDISDEKRDELRKLVLDWLNANAEKPRFYQVVNVEKITANFDGYSLNW